MTEESQAFRAAMAQLGSAVCILTTDGPGGLYGITVSAVTAVSDDPPSLIVCVNRGSGANAPIKENRRVCVNVLSCDQERISAAFSDPATEPADRFKTGDWSTSLLGNPQLSDTAASFDCQIAQTVEFGTHSVFFCRVARTSVSQNTTCLIYHGRAYHKIEGFS